KAKFPAVIRTVSLTQEPTELLSLTRPRISDVFHVCLCAYLSFINLSAVSGFTVKLGVGKSRFSSDFLLRALRSPESGLSPGPCADTCEPRAVCRYLRAEGRDVYVLSEEEGLVLRAVEAFNDTQECPSPSPSPPLPPSPPPLPPSPPPPPPLHCIAALTLLSLLPPSLPRSLCQRGDEDEEEEEDEDGERAKRSRRSAAGVPRRPGDRWMLRGPIEYVPPTAVEVVLRRQAIPLDENEGIYVRDIKTGKTVLQEPNADPC
ncbi:hypothetical protein FQN60_004460, partial [Etheostoma spectabile]